MSALEKLYEGKAKILYKGPKPGTLIQYFKDDATAFNAQKKGTFANKGLLNNYISEVIMGYLEKIGIPTHLIERIDDRQQLIRQVEIIPLEIIVRNIAAGSICTRLGLTEGDPLPRPLIEFCYKEDALNDPLIAEEHIVTFGWATEDELATIFELTQRINDFLCGLFAAIGIQLVDFKLEYGRREQDGDIHVILADEISPDNCRLWDIKTGEKMDKDRFRRDLGGETEAYTEVARRLGITIATENT
ncbi:MAG: phosphoribosylaminoimidazolesuccinocarboxamide synthase [Kordiimonas sp.]|nr:phosphoribosylaminoimidazolesuccinocarboxamide synthase [Kordiimonas sp.]